MCTLVLLVRPDHEWPVMVAATRDEFRTRSWQAPAVVQGLLGLRRRIGSLFGWDHQRPAWNAGWLTPSLEVH
jgi:uncharacterized protein with NRDE domain